MDAGSSETEDSPRPRGKHSEEVSESSTPPPPDGFIAHRVTSMDTLAGLAVKYAVTVSDIRRCNGLLSDSVMFARDSLLIPTRPLPVGREFSTWASVIATHYGTLGGRQEALKAYSHLEQATLQNRGSASADLAESTSPLAGLGSLEYRLFLSRGASGDEGEEGDLCHLVAAGRRRSAPLHEVELSQWGAQNAFPADRLAANASSLPPLGPGGGAQSPAWAADKLRRRRAAGEDASPAAPAGLDLDFRDEAGPPNHRIEAAASSSRASSSRALARPVAEALGQGLRSLRDWGEGLAAEQRRRSAAREGARKGRDAPSTAPRPAAKGGGDGGGHFVAQRASAVQGQRLQGGGQRRKEA